MHDAELWAEEQFGHADLGDTRRTRRLVQLATEVVRRPSSVVSRVCETSASREGAFRLLESSSVRASALSTATRLRTVAACEGKALVIVPIDGSALTIRDRARKKGVGSIGSRTSKGRGIQTMNALALAPDGTPIGLCGQRMWTRDKRSTRTRYDNATTSENRFWLEMIQEVHDSFAQSTATPWMQLDRGADCWPVLKLAVELQAHVTVRAAQDRNLHEGGHLWSTLENAKVRLKLRIPLAARPPRERKRRIPGKQITYMTAPRRARTAKVEVRSATVPLLCSITTKRRVVVPFHAVFVREVGGPRNDRIEWMLLTTHPIRTRADVRAVVDAYTCRWRIEDFHRAWKRGLCGVENMRLRSREAIFKWATLLAAVAARALRLTRLSRETPDALATTEFSVYELQAILAHRRPKGFDDEHIPSLTLAQAIRWIADFSGYNGPWKGPPGATIVGRGLEQVIVTAQALEYRDKKR